MGVVRRREFVPSPWRPAANDQRMPAPWHLCPVPVLLCRSNMRSGTIAMSSRSSPRRRGVAVALLTALGACASTPPPIDAVAAADLALQQAETAPAATYAAGGASARA